MSSRQLVYTAVLLPFLALTAYVLVTTGLVGFYAVVLGSSPGLLSFTDLSIALGLILVWMFGDSRATHTPFAPYVVITLAIGVAGPLLYLIHRDARAGRTLQRGARAESA